VPAEVIDRGREAGVLSRPDRAFILVTIDQRLGHGPTERNENKKRTTTRLSTPRSATVWFSREGCPMSVTYHVVVPFDRIESGELVPGEAKEAPSQDAAKRRAQALAEKHAGALAFSRTGNPDSGDFGDAEVIAVYGAVDTGALQG
jgi:hypothetical protein